MTLAPVPASGRVLIVEDHQLSRRLYGRWLVGAGYEVHLAGSADEATGLLNMASFDLALVDVSMPGRDGLWLSEYIRRRHPHVSIVFVTGVEELPASETLSPGVVGYLLKPIEREDLLGIVRQAVRGTHLRPPGLPFPPQAPEHA